MPKYFVIEDRHLGHFGSRSALIYQGRSRFYHSEYSYNPGKIAFFHLKQELADKNATLEQVLAAYLSSKNIPPAEHLSFRIALLKTQLGKKYGRIVRPVRGFGSAFANKKDEQEIEEVLDLYAQMDVLMLQFAEIVKVVDPSVSNLRTYGYEIRNLLILACTEVELLFKRLFCLDASNSRANMPAFFSGANAAKLTDYNLRFNFYRQIGGICPFSDWIGQNNYVPLSWYKAYNGTKHNRHLGMEEASLDCLIYALAACAVLLKAQSSYEHTGNPKSPTVLKFETNFSIRGPSWPIEEQY